MLVVLDVGTTQFTPSSDKTGIYKIYVYTEYAYKDFIARRPEISSNTAL